MTSMQAAVWTRYGPPEVLELREVPRPAPPKDDEILVKILVSNVFPGDCELRRFDIHSFFWLPIRLGVGVFKPRTYASILGQEFSGVVEAVGSGVTAFKSGDAVFGPTSFGGTYCEYTKLKARHLHHKPESLSFDQAAALSVGGTNALHFLKQAQVKGGDTVLLFGAGGSIGTLAIQIAKAWGAEVTVVERGDKLETIAALGADHLIDYTRDDFTQNGFRYDVIIDMPGKSDYGNCLKSLAPGGRYILGNASAAQMLRAPWARWLRGKQVRSVLAPYKREYFAELLELVEAGKIKPLIDRRFGLNEVVAAHRYVESGDKTGNVLLTIASPLEE